MPSVLVTGGAGYIGSVTCLRLREAGYEVHCLDDLSAGHRAAVPPGVRLVQLDLEDVGRVRRVLVDSDIEVVVHFAGAIEPGSSMLNPMRFYRDNVVRSAGLVEELVRIGGIPLIYSSTCAVYGQPAELPVTEATPPAPDSVYGRTKLTVEHMLADCWQAHRLPSLALRYFNACGALPEHGLGPDHLRKIHLVTRLLAAAAGLQRELVVHGDDYATPDGTCIRDYIHVDDLASAHVAAVRSVLSTPRRAVYNLGLGRGYSVRQMLDLAVDVVGHDVPYRVGPRRPGDPAQIFADASLARAELGWSPKWNDMREVIESAWVFAQAYPDGYPT